jgi:hypothetical protein
MSEEEYEKEFGPIDAARERTNTYGLGFDIASFLGFMLPTVIVVGVGAIGGWLIYHYL